MSRPRKIISLLMPLEIPHEDVLLMPSEAISTGLQQVPFMVPLNMGCIHGLTQSTMFPRRSIASNLMPVPAISP